MIDLMIEEDRVLSDLLAREGPAAPAWITRTHQALSQQWPEAFVFLLGPAIEAFTRWMDAAGVDRLDEHLFSRIAFEEDRDGPRRHPEGGRIAFRWSGADYRVFAVQARGPRHMHVFTWVISPDRATGEALVDAVGRHARSRKAAVMVFEDGDWEEAPRLGQSLAGFNWEAIVLPEEMRERIRGATERFFRSERVYADLGIPWKLGFLLVGPPGTGKTLTTKILANSCGVPFLYVRGLNSFCGDKPDNGTVREMFEGTRERAPCILCLEDVDSLVTEEVRSTFLNELDGLEEDYRGVLTVATTNHPEKLDPALLHRPCRFDYRFEFPLPDEAQRRAFVHHWIERLTNLGYVTEGGEALEEVVRRNRGMSHAYLKRVLVAVALRMHNLGEHGDAAFARLAREEIADAAGDRDAARRLAAGTREAVAAARVGFRSEEGI